MEKATSVLASNVSAAIVAGDAVIFPAYKFRRFSLVILATDVTYGGANVNVVAKVTVDTSWVILRSEFINEDRDVIFQFEGPWESVSVSITNYRGGKYTVLISGQD